MLTAKGHRLRGCIACAPTADTAIGTSDKGLARRVAVTMILVPLSSTTGCGAAASCARAAGANMHSANAPTVVSKGLLCVMMSILSWPARLFAASGLG